MNAAVRMAGITKRFGALKALEDVRLDVEQGTIHAVVGENGAGKTTLMRILYGALHPDHGAFEIDGKLVKIKSPKDASKFGIGMVSQHYSVIPELSCIENLMLGAERAPILSRKKAKARAEELASKMGFKFDWDASAATLTPASNQKLEILKLLWRNAKILILDEPTSMLSPGDSDALFKSLKGLAAEGATVILVTHRLPEVMQHCKVVTVLRGGRKVADRIVAQTNPEELTQLMVGAALQKPDPKQSRTNNVLLEVSRLSVMGAKGDMALMQVSFDLHRGEILGIAGVDGNGQRELIQSLMGAIKSESGFARFEGSDILDFPTSYRLRLGFRLIPEDRHEEGMVEQWSLEENAALGLQRFRPFAKGPFVNVEGRKTAARQIAARFNTRHGGLNDKMASLSGGNQQRFVIGRALELWPTVILAFQPARGLDIRAAQHVYAGFREACSKGAAVLVVSFDLDELLENCDRVLVATNGFVKAPPKGYELDRQTIGRVMVGAS